MKKLITILIMTVMVFSILHIMCVCSETISNSPVGVSSVHATAHHHHKKKHKKVKVKKLKKAVNIESGAKVCTCRTCKEMHLNCYNYGKEYRLHGDTKPSVKCDCTSWKDGFNAPTGFEGLDGYRCGEELFYNEFYNHENVWLVYDQNYAKEFITVNGGIWTDYSEVE